MFDNPKMSGRKIRRLRNLSVAKIDELASLDFPDEKNKYKRRQMEYSKLITGIDRVPLSKEDSKIVTLFFQDKGYPDGMKSIRNIAKVEGLTVPEKMKQLFSAIPKKTEFVRAECFLWTTTEGKNPSPGQEKKEFDGVECVRTRREKPFYIALPKQLAHTWGPNIIDELVTKLRELNMPQYQNFISEISHVSASNGTFALEVLGTSLPESYKGTIPDIEFSPTWGPQMVLSCKYLRGQFETHKYNEPNLCLLNCVMEQYSDTWNSYVSKLKQTPKNGEKYLSYRKLASLLGKSLKTLSVEGISFRQAFVIFEWLNINATLYVLGSYDSLELVSEYKSPKRSKVLQSHFFLIRYSGHFYRISESKIKSGLTREDPIQKASFTVSSKFPNYNKKSNRLAVFGKCVKTLDEILDDEHDEDAQYVWRSDPHLEFLVPELLDRGYHPTNLSINAYNMITRLTIPGPNGKRVIKVFDCDQEVTDEQLKIYFELENKLRKTFLDRTNKSGHLSCYSDSLRECLYEFRGAPQVGLFQETEEKFAQGYDVVNCFPYNLKIQENLPIFALDDQLMKYNGEPIEDYNLYVYKGGSSYGKYLSETPLGYFRPSKLKKNNLGKLIDEIMGDKRLPRALRKQMMNRMIGCLGKKYNTRDVNELFTCEMDAFREYGTVHKFSEDIWLGHNFAAVEFDDGFLPIHKLVYDSVNYSMKKLKEDFESKGARVIGVITDNLLVHVDDVLDFPEVYPDSVESIGKIKKETCVKDISFRKVIQPRKNCNHVLTIPKVPETTVLIMMDEYDEFEASQLLMEGNWVVTAVVPGSGKTYLACVYAKNSGKSYVVATFSNEQALEIKKQGHPAMTLYKTCGGVVGLEDEAYGSKKFEIVIIDELGLHNSINRKMIKRYMEQHPETQFLATEDSFQISPIETDWNGDSEWYQRNTASLFPSEINLRIPKRFGPENSAKVIKLKKDLFEEPRDISEILQEFACNKKDWLSIWTPETLCISYYHDTREKVNKTIHFEKLGFSEYYMVGQHYLAMRGTFHPDVYTNCKYKLVSVSKDSFELQDVLDKTVIKVKRFGKKGEDKLKENNLTLPYCRTCHVSQGKTCEGPVIVFDTASSRVTRNWLYVALTRSRKLEVYIAGNSLPRLDVKYVRKKLEGYKKQDADRKFTWDDEEYCSVSDVLKLSKSCGHTCSLCGNVMNVANKSEFHPWNWTLDRINNSFPHLKSNVRLAHESCNVAGKSEIEHEG